MSIEPVFETPLLRYAVKRILPGGDPKAPDSRVFPIYVRMGELRALRSLASEPPEIEIEAAADRMERWIDSEASPSATWSLERDDLIALAKAALAMGDSERAPVSEKSA